MRASLGVSLRVEQLEMALDNLQAAVVEGAMTPEAAVREAQGHVLAAIPDLRFGARLRPKRFFAPTSLPAIAELGRICGIVRRLADDLAALADTFEGSRPALPAPAVRLRIHTVQE